MKKFLNDPNNFVAEMLEGVHLANPGKFKLVPEFNLIYRADRPDNSKVSLIQGSGSGHEPAHIMAVGPGMLDAASPGAVFAAPPVDTCLACIEHLKSDAGVLVLINNYQGDRMAWDMAIEMAQGMGIKVEKFIINDDVAVPDSTYSIGRRGVAGNFFVIKALGAAAEKGASLEELLKIADKVNSQVRSFGVALSSCVPPLKGAREVTDELIDAILAEMEARRGDRVAVLVNSLGATPLMELYILYARVAERLADAGLLVHKALVGPYCTSLEMAGASITVMHLDDELIRLIDHPCDCAMFRQG